MQDNITISSVECNNLPPLYWFFNRLTTFNNNDMSDGPDKIFDDRIFVKDKKNCFIKIDIADILWIKGGGSYSVIETTNGQFTTTHNLKSIENKIHHHNLLRVHRSYIVNFSKIKHIEGKNYMVIDAGHLNLPEEDISINEKEIKREIKIPIGPEYRSTICKLIKLI